MVDASSERELEAWLAPFLAVAHQQRKDELGLDHFESRSWTGLHRHTLCATLDPTRPVPTMPKALQAAL